MIRRHSGFTMIELLVVLAVIGVLAGLLLTGASVVRRKAAEWKTADRIEKILAGLQQMRAAGQSQAAVLQRDALGVVPGDFASLAEILNDLDRNPAWIPSGLRSAGQSVRVPPNLAYTTKIDNWEGRGRDVRLETRIVMYPAAEDRPGASYFGEHLERTLEVSPGPAQQPTRPDHAWYRAAWPIVWPASDWDQDDPGVIPPVLGTPFGQPAWEVVPRTVNGGSGPTGTWGTHVVPVPTGALAGDPVPFDLSRFDPTRTVALLVASGILPAADAAHEYATDRSAQRGWNDAYGNPLVVAAVSFLPPRHEIWDFYARNMWPQNNRDLGASGVVNQARPRDFLIESARRHFGHWRSVSISVGAMGSGVPASVSALATSGSSLSWTPTNERALLRAAWLAIAGDCDAAAWTSTAVGAPPWQGLRVVRASEGGGWRCLSAPVEIR